METVLKILLVEDLTTDAELIKREIKKNDLPFIDHRVETKEDYIKALQDFKPEIILSDYSLPKFNGMQALHLRQELAPSIPFILVTGSNNEEIAVECIQNGADDYILKDNLIRLVPAMEAAINKQATIVSKKESEEALFESEELFRTAFENAAIGVCLLSTEGMFVNVNSTFCNMLGYSRDEIMQMPFNQITFSADRQIGTSFLQELNKRELNSVNFEKRYVHKLGYIVWVNISTGLVYSPKKKSQYFVSYVQDITERKKSEEQLLIAKKKAEESDNLKTAFLHNISHEIRTPLNAIVGFSALLADPLTVSEKRSRYSDIIVKSSDQLLSIISNIINISTIEAGQERLLIKDFNLNSKCRLLTEQFSVKANNQKILFECNTALSDYEANIKSDETKLVQVLTNLLDNAFKFTKQGHIYFGYELKDNYIEFYVEDSGIGIHSDMHQNIFKRFRQVENHATRLYGGSGLGLSIAKAYVELLGGKISLLSEPGKGSVFNFTIPYNKTEQDFKKEEQPDNEIRVEVKKPKTILIAEDEDLNYEYIEELLSNLNFTIIRAINGIKAVEICKSNPQLDMVLMDIKMPLMNGYEATTLIKEFRPGIPVIAQTAYSNDADKNKALECGCVDFICKPFNAESLLEKIYKQLQK
jgi:PAS domain S-box-containing protein